MNFLKCSLRLTAVLATSLFVVACSSDPDPVDAGPGAGDAGVRDTGGNGNPDASDAGNSNADATADAGNADTGRTDSGRDGGMTAACVPGTEGCPCTFDPTDMSEQSNCEVGLTCVPWNLRENEMTPEASDATCIRPCDTNAECTNAAFSMCSQAIAWQSDPQFLQQRNFCAPSLVAAGETCRAAVRNATNRVVGCQAGSSCQVGFDFNTGAIPFEGTCTSTCTWTIDAPGGGCAGAGVCNPFLGTATSTEAFGFCDTEVRLPGSACVDGIANAACAFQATTLCLSSANDPNGTCVEICDPAEPLATECGAQRLASNDRTNSITCELIPTSTFGICDNNCSSFPNGCVGDSQCNEGSVTVNGTDSAEFGTCMPLQPPYFSVSYPDVEGGQIQPGSFPAGFDDCAATTAQCPPGAVCLAANAAMTQGACGVFCSTSTSATFPRGGCETFTSTAVRCQGLIDNSGVIGTDGVCGI